MKLYNQEGTEVMVEKDQVKILLDAGWSKTLPKKAVKKEKAKVQKPKDSEDSEDSSTEAEIEEEYLPSAKRKITPKKIAKKE